jgi:putative oxidoreductase
MTSLLEPAGLLLGRVLLALLFVHEGWAKLVAYDNAVRYAEAFGVPGLLLPAAIAVDLCGGILLAAGLAARATAFLLGGFCVVTAFIFHTNFGSRGELLQFEKDLAIAGGFFVLSVCGAGAWALDHLVFRISRR